MQRWRFIIWGVVLIAALAGCGGDQPGGGGGEEAPVQARPTPTVRTTARDRPLPLADPYDFEAPLSVRNFVRESISGHATTVESGGQQAIYALGSDAVILNTYAFASHKQAVENLRFMLDLTVIERVITPPNYHHPSIVLGIAEDRHGGFMAVWAHEQWMFAAHTGSSQDVLMDFLEAFPY